MVRSHSLYPQSGAAKKKEAFKLNRIGKVIQSIGPFLGFFLRPEHRRSGVNVYRVRFKAPDAPLIQRVTRTVAECTSICHGFCYTVVHRVPNNPLFVLLPDFVSHRNPGESSQIWQSIALLWRITPFSSVRTAYPHFSSVMSISSKSKPWPSECTFSRRFHPGRISGRSLNWIG